MSKEKENNPCQPAGSGMVPSCSAGLSEALSSDLFKALADPNRLSLLARLATLGRPATVSEVAGCCPVDFSVVSRHLGILKTAGVLEASKKGREVFYEARCAELAALLRQIASALEQCCPPPTVTTDKGTTPAPSRSRKKKKTK